jgi:hypothetical protein
VPLCSDKNQSSTIDKFSTWELYALSKVLQLYLDAGYKRHPFHNEIMADALRKINYHMISSVIMSY